MRLRRLPDSPSRQRARRTVAALEKDELPPELVARLRRGGPATSAFSVADAAALQWVGAEPLALVSGPSVVKRLHQPMPSPTPRSAVSQGWVRELSVRSEAWNVARGRAIRRLRREAELAGANAVVGIRLRRAERTDEQGDVFNLVEVVATGTAVRAPYPGPTVLTSLRGTDLATLDRSGWRPVGLVAASTVCYVVAGRATMDQFGLTWAQGGTNSEFGDYTRGLYVARSRALGRVEGAARQAGAAGIVALQYEQEIRPARREGFGTRDLEVTLHVVATAIACARAGEPAAPRAAVSVG